MDTSPQDPAPSSAAKFRSAHVEKPRDHPSTSCNNNETAGTGLRDEESSADIKSFRASLTIRLKLILEYGVGNSTCVWYLVCIPERWLNTG